MRMVLIVLILLVVATGAAAEPIRMEADGLGRYDTAAQLLVVDGRVTLWVDEREIVADRLQWDMAADTLLFQGNVQITQDGSEMDATSFYYERQTGEGKILDVFSRITIDNVEGPIFVLGDSVALRSDLQTMEQARITTCDLDQPHYHVAVRSLEIHVNEKIVIRGVVYYEGKIPLFYWPYLAIPLQTDLQQNQLALPRVGYSTDEGWFLKNSYGYFFSPAAYGSLFLDFFTRQSTGIGFRHNYIAAGLGQLLFYTQPGEEHWRLNWDHQWQWRNWYGSFQHQQQQNLISEELRQQQNSQVLAYYRGEALRVDAEARLTKDSTSSVSESYELKGSGSYVFSPQLRLNVEGSYQNRPQAEFPRMINYLGHLQYRSGPHDAALRLQQRYNPDLLDDEVARPNWSSVNRLPELTYTYRSGPLGAWDFGVGHFTQFPASIESWRTNVGLEYRRQTWNPLPQAVLTFTGRSDARWYSQGHPESDTYFSLTNRLQWRQSLTDSLTWTTVYSRRDLWGETPFNFDRWREQNQVTTELSFFTPQLSLSLRGGYNFDTDRYETVVAHLRQRPSVALRWDLYAYYDMNQWEMGNIAATVQYKPNDILEAQLGVRYSVSRSSWQRLDGKLTIPLGDRWSLDLDAIYYPEQERFTRGGVGLTWDLHCRELTFRYDHVKSQVWLEYTLNAFPNLPISFGTGDTTSLFNLDDIQDILGIPDEVR